MAADPMKINRSDQSPSKSFCLLFLSLLTLVAVSISWAGTPRLEVENAIRLMGEKEYAQAIELLHAAESAIANRDELSGLIATAYLGRGYQLLSENALTEAQEYFREGREYDDRRSELWQGEAMCLYKLGQYAEAAALLNEAIGHAPENAHLYSLQGRSYYAAGRMQESIDSLTRSVEMGGGEEAAALLGKVRREWQVEREMGREVRGHFELSFVDGPHSAELAVEILNTLEDAYAEIGSELAFYPDVRVPVLLYTKQDFSSITRSPDWAGGVYDGKIRIPLGGVHAMSDRLAAILYHEYSHVVLRFMAYRNLPVWLNEGMAELFGRRLYAPPLDALETAIDNGELLEWEPLARAFASLPEGQVLLAYQQSYSMVAFMVEQYGLHKLVELLAELGKKKDWQVAIADVYQSYGLDWPAIQTEWQASLGL